MVRGHRVRIDLDLVTCTQTGPRRECQALNVGTKKPLGKNWEVSLEGETVTAANHMSGRTTEPCDKHRWAHNTGWNSICQGHTITGWDVGGAMSPDLKTDLQVSLS